MTHDPVKDVLEFSTTFRCPVGTKKEVPDGPHTVILRQIYGHLMDLRTLARAHAKEDVRCQRVALNIEELGEEVDAWAKRDLKGILDACTDKQYVNVGDLVTCGLHEVYYESWDRVHESNMTKTDENGNPIFDETGKVKKSDRYVPVDLTDLVND